MFTKPVNLLAGDGAFDTMSCPIPGFEENEEEPSQFLDEILRLRSERVEKDKVTHHGNVS